MMRCVLPMIALLLLTLACGDDQDLPNRSPTPNNKANAAEWSIQYTKLGEARQLLTDLGLDGVSLGPEAYQCIQSGCPDEAPGDESWGCLRVLPTGDPVNAESLYPDDPPGWYSVVWEGAFGETYSARPEPVVHEPIAELEERNDIACGAGFALETTAEDAAKFLEESGFSSTWRSQAQPAPTCAPDTDCPIPGVTAETVGCLGISIFNQPGAGDQGEPGVTVYVNWSSSNGAEYHEGVNLSSSTIKLVAEIEEAVAGMDEGGCLKSPAPEPDPYDSIPYTDSLQPTYWHLEKAVSGTTLLLQVAAGGGCEEFERVDVFETEELVTINGFIRRSAPGPNSACTDDLKYHQTTVELDESLGDRDLLGCAPQEIWYVDHETDCAVPGQR